MLEGGFEPVSSQASPATLTTSCAEDTFRGEPCGSDRSPGGPCGQARLLGSDPERGGGSGPARLSAAHPLETWSGGTWPDIWPLGGIPPHSWPWVCLQSPKDGVEDRLRSQKKTQAPPITNKGGRVPAGWPPVGAALSRTGTERLQRPAGHSLPGSNTPPVELTAGGRPSTPKPARPPARWGRPDCQGQRGELPSLPGFLALWVSRALSSSCHCLPPSLKKQKAWMGSQPARCEAPIPLGWENQGFLSSF